MMKKGINESAADSTVRVRKASERIWPNVGWIDPTVADGVKLPKKKKKDLLAAAEVVSLAR